MFCMCIRFLIVYHLYLSYFPPSSVSLILFLTKNIKKYKNIKRLELLEFIQKKRLH